MLSVPSKADLKTMKNYSKMNGVVSSPKFNTRASPSGSSNDSEDRLRRTLIKKRVLKRNN